MNKIKIYLSFIFLLLSNISFLNSINTPISIRIHEVSFLKMNPESNSKMVHYSLTPTPKKYVECGIKAKYTNNEDCNEVIESSINCDDLSFTITCKKEFEQNIIVSIYLLSNPKIASQIIVKYEKKLKSLTSIADQSIIDVFDDQNGNADFILYRHPVSFELFCKPIYSKYSLDKDYPFSLKFKDIKFIDEDLPQFPQEYGFKHVDEAICDLILYYLENECELNEELIYQFFLKHHADNEFILDFLCACVKEESFALVEVPYTIFLGEDDYYDGQCQIEIEFSSLNFKENVTHE